MATIVDKNAAYMALPMNIKRGNPIPLDTTAVWSDLTELTTYAKSGATAYVGQILTLVASGKCEAYMIADANGTLTKLAQTTASGDLASDVAVLQTAVKERIKGLAAADTSITVTTTTTSDGADKNATVKVNLSATTGNNLKLNADGLYVPTPTIPDVPVYAIRKENPTTGDYSAVYHLTKDGTDVDVPINIPKDLVVSNGEVKTYATKAEATTDGMSVDQADKETFPSTFIKLTIANKTDTSLFINVGGLIEYVTAGGDTDGIMNVVIPQTGADAHKVFVSITPESVPKTKFTKEVQASLGLADTALQKADITTGATNGTIKVDGADIKVKGLEDGAYKTVKEITTIAQTEANNALLGAKSYTETRLGDLGIKEGTTQHTVKSYVDTKITDVNSSISTINTTLAGKANTATTLDGYGITDAMTSEQITKKITETDNTIRTALKGTTEDTSDKETIAGAKKYAEEKANFAAADAKSYAAGLIADSSTFGKRVKALEDTHAKVGGTGEDKEKFKTVAQEVQAGITALDLDNTYAKKTDLPTYDDKSVGLKNSKVEIKGFADADAATFPQKNADGTIHWVPASEMSVGTDGKSITSTTGNKLTLKGFADVTTANYGKNFVPTVNADGNLKFGPVATDNRSIARDTTNTLTLNGFEDASTGKIPYISTQSTGSSNVKVLKWRNENGIDTNIFEYITDEHDDKDITLKNYSTANYGTIIRKGAENSGVGGAEIKYDTPAQVISEGIDNKTLQANTTSGTVNNIGLYGATSATAGQVPFMKSNGQLEWKDAYDSTKITELLSSVYKAKGSITADEITTLECKEETLGYVYNVSQEFTTTDKFIEGGGNTYPAGTNIVVVLSGTAYKLDVLAGFVNLTDYAKTVDINTKLDKKVDKVEGSRLMTTAEGAKLAGLYDKLNPSLQVIADPNDDNKLTLGVKSVEASQVNGLSAYANKIETVKVNGTALTITDKAVNIPGATASALGVVKGSSKTNDVAINADFTMTVNSISTDKLVQGTNTIIWNGGNASTT